MASYYVHAVVSPPFPTGLLADWECEILSALGWELTPIAGGIQLFVDGEGWRDELEATDAPDLLAKLPSDLLHNGGDLGNYALLQHLVVRHGLPYLTVEMSFTCSKMAPDGFGGAAYLITADKIESVSTGEWLAEKLAAAGHGEPGP